VLQADSSIQCTGEDGVSDGEACPPARRPPVPDAGHGGQLENPLTELRAASCVTVRDAASVRVTRSRYPTLAGGPPVSRSIRQGDVRGNVRHR
jgi:hypothetical protein